MKEFKRNVRTTVSPGFKKQILKMVLARVDFGPLFSFESIVGPYQEKFQPNYPDASVEETPGYDIDIKNIRTPKVSVRELVKTFCLYNPMEKKKLKFSSNSLILEHHTYVSFETFLGELDQALSFLFKSKEQVFTPKRIGLRKVASVVLPETETLDSFADVFNDALVQHLKIPFVDRSLQNDKHLLSFSIDEIGVNFQFSSEKGSQEQKGARRFVLDFDVYTRHLESNVDTCLELYKRMNDLQFDIFWWSIGPRLERYLHGESTEFD